MVNSDHCCLRYAFQREDGSLGCSGGGAGAWDLGDQPDLALAPFPLPFLFPVPCSLYLVLYIIPVYVIEYKYINS